MVLCGRLHGRVGRRGIKIEPHDTFKSVVGFFRFRRSILTISPYCIIMSYIAKGGTKHDKHHYREAVRKTGEGIGKGDKGRGWFKERGGAGRHRALSCHKKVQATAKEGLAFCRGAGAADG